MAADKRLPMEIIAARLGFGCAKVSKPTRELQE